VHEDEKDGRDGLVEKTLTVGSMLLYIQVHSTVRMSRNQGSREKCDVRWEFKNFL
jgi:hypothetical protein